MRKNFYLFSFLLLFLSSCNGGVNYVGVWVGTLTEESAATPAMPYNDKVTSNYTITIEQNGSCKIIERKTGQVYNEQINETYTYFGTWKANDGYIGDGTHYSWIELNASTEEKYEFYEPKTGRKAKRKISTTVSITPDGKMWGGDLNAERLAKAIGGNSYNGVTQLRKQN